MYLTSFSYSEYTGRPQAWSIEPFRLAKVTLLVGKNATGKTRTLNAIFGIGRLLSGQQSLTYQSGQYQLQFSYELSQEQPSYQYELDYEDKSVVLERLVEGTVVRLQRSSSGTGTIYAEKIESDLDFQIANNQLAAAVKRDLAQHTYLEHIYNWAQSVRILRLGRQTQNLGIFIAGEPSVDTVSSESSSIAAAFISGERNFGPERFNAEIVKNMNELGYPIQTIQVIDLGSLRGVTVPPGMPIQILAIKEKDVNVSVDQSQMSAGMFRALDVLVRIHLAKLQERPFCLLIDDIGEGLDFARSSALVQLLVKFVEDSELQVVMTTNDRFIMNTVPLKYWSVVHREGGSVLVFNERSHPKAFKEFEDLGLSNFDFFSRKVFLER